MGYPARDVRCSQRWARALQWVGTSTSAPARAPLRLGLREPRVVITAGVAVGLTGRRLSFVGAFRAFGVEAALLFLHRDLYAVRIDDGVVAVLYASEFTVLGA